MGLNEKVIFAKVLYNDTRRAPEVTIRYQIACLAGSIRSLGPSGPLVYTILVKSG